MSSLDKYRNMIDAIDDKILDLLNERAEHVKSVGNIKKGSNSPVWVPSRESSIYERLTERNKEERFQHLQFVLFSVRLFLHHYHLKIT